LGHAYNVTHRIYPFLKIDIYRKNSVLLLVVHMQLIEIPEFPILRGEKAIKVLHDFIDELQEQRGKELTEKQTAALIRFARGLISSIEAETRSGTLAKNIKEMHSVALAYSPWLFSISATSQGMLHPRGPL